MECPHITQGQTVSLTLKDLTSIIKGGVKCSGTYSSTRMFAHPTFTVILIFTGRNLCSSVP